MSKPKVIALYLPQYHPTPDNNKWWGKGFTEWTNVGKAKPLFRGHYQPKVPADLGYYDLRVPEVREAQAQLAKEAGIDGFCYYHYWFGNGRQELELPFNEVLKSGKPDFPFMLCWANESWHKKFWNKDGKGTSKEVLIEQTYPDGDIITHFKHLLPAFKDQRYIHIDGKPAFMIYKPLYIPDCHLLISEWNRMAQDNGLKGIFFIAHMQSELEQKMTERQALEYYNNIGFNAVNIVRLTRPLELRSKTEVIYSKIKRAISHLPLTFPYKAAYQSFTRPIDREAGIFPTIIPNWDHTPRSGLNGLVYTGSTPELFAHHVDQVMKMVNDKHDPNIVFIKSWNEWGEGNYIEPDLKFGKKYLSVLKEILDRYRSHQ